MQVALATDRLRVPGTSEETIVSTDVIAARNTTSRALARLGKRRGGGGGSPSPVGKERAEESEGDIGTLWEACPMQWRQAQRTVWHSTKG